MEQIVVLHGQGYTLIITLVFLYSTFILVLFYSTLILCFCFTSFSPHLEREKHLSYLKKGLLQLSSAYECLDASRPWLCYWILHSCQLLDVEIPEQESSLSIDDMRGIRKVHCRTVKKQRYKSH